MFRLWGKIIADGKVKKDSVAVCADYSISRKDMVFLTLRDICHEFDIPEPIWFQNNVDEFARRARVRFNSDNFIEQISFDYFEIEIVEV